MFTTDSKDNLRRQQSVRQNCLPSKQTTSKEAFAADDKRGRVTFKIHRKARRITARTDSK